MKTGNLTRTGSIVVNTATNYARFGIMFLVFTLVTPRMIRGIGQSSYGVWTLVFAVTGFFGLFDLGFGTASVRYIARSRNQGIGARELLVARLFVTYLFLAAVSFLAAVLIDPFLGGILDISGKELAEGRVLFRLLVLRTAVLYLPLSLFRHILYGYQRIWFVNLVQALFAGIYGIGTLIIIDSGGGIIALGTLNLGTMIFEHLVYLVAVSLEDRGFSFRHLLKMCMTVLPGVVKPARPGSGSSGKEAEADSFKDIFSLSLYSFLINLVVLVQMRSDPLVINMLVDNPLQSVAIYAVAMKICEYYLLMIKQFGSVLSPLVAELQGQGDSARIRFLLVAGTKYAFLPAIMAGSFLLATSGTLIVAWAGPEFAGAAPALILTVVAILASVPEMIGSTVLTMTGEHRFAGRVAFLGMVLNLCFTAIFVALWGITGAALGTLVACIIVDWFIIIPRVLRLYRIRIREYVMVLLPPVIITGSLDFFVTRVLSARAGMRLSGIAISAIPGAVLCLTVFFVFFMNRKEKELFRSALRRKSSRDIPSGSPSDDPASELAGAGSALGKESGSESSEPVPERKSFCTDSEVGKLRMQLLESGRCLEDEDPVWQGSVHQSDPFFNPQYQEYCRRHVFDLPPALLVADCRVRVAASRSQASDSQSHVDKVTDESGLSALFEKAWERRGFVPFLTLRSIDFNATSIRRFDDPVEGKGALDSLLDMREELARTSNALLLRMHKLSMASAEALASALDIRNIPYSKTFFNSNYHVSLPENPEEYWSTKSPKAMYNLRRSRRLMEKELGQPCQYLVLVPGCDGCLSSEDRSWVEKFLELMDRVALLRAGTGTGTGGMAGSGVSVNREFYRSVIRSWASGDGMELSLLVAGERILAGQVNLRRTGRLTIALMGFDDHFAQYSPGRILLSSFINDAHERGFRLIELGGEGESWKREWANFEESTWSISFPILHNLISVWRMTAWLKTLFSPATRDQSGDTLTGTGSR